LDGDVRQAFADSGGQPVILIANSLGAAVTRGFLAYSSEANDGAATTMVDSVIFMEGAQSGSHLAFDISHSSAASRISPVLNAVATTIGQINPTRPAIDRKSTRLNSSPQIISYAVFCLKKKNN